MNKNRRKVLYAVANKLIALKSSDKKDIEADFEAAKNVLDGILYEEESYMDDMPENMQSGYKHQKAEDACSNIEDAIDALNDEDIDAAISYIYSATV
jgi:predicted Zn-dependent peptidase